MVLPRHAEVELEMQETDAMTAAIKEMGLEFPALMAPLLYERDLYMVKQLRSLSK